MISKILLTRIQQVRESQVSLLAQHGHVSSKVEKQNMIQVYSLEIMHVKQFKILFFQKNMLYFFYT